MNSRFPLKKSHRISTLCLCLSPSFSAVVSRSATVSLRRRHLSLSPPSLSFSVSLRLRLCLCLNSLGDLSLISLELTEVMESLHIQRGVRRVLFRISNTDKRLMFKKEFDSSFAGFMTDGAKWLVENTDIKLIGLDYLSFAAFEESPATHRIILKGRDIIPVEALKLDGVEVGTYSLHCLPLRLVNAEGAPTRCILIK